VKHFGHKEPVFTEVMLGRELLKISGSPLKVHENSANGLVADARSQSDGRVLVFICIFLLRREFSQIQLLPHKKRALVSGEKIN
jgi:hypothetical protein